MKVSTLAGLVATAIPVVFAQTHNSCNPLDPARNETICAPLDCQYALGKTITWDFKKGPTDYVQSEPWFPVSYKSDGVHLDVGKKPGKDSQGNAFPSWSPAIVTGHRIMWGRLDAKMKIAPGKGIVSSLVLLSSTLDEIDWEWVGSKPTEALSNYFGKGDIQQWNRGQTHEVSDASKNFHTWSIEWDTNSIKWEVDGVVVREMTRAQSKAHYVPDKKTYGDKVNFPYPDYYPQTPMQIKIGAWAGGDPANEPGVIEWADGPTDFTQGPFTMVVDSITITDFTTGAGRYCYTDQSKVDGSFESIKVDKNTPFQPAPVPIEGGPVQDKKTSTTKASTLSTTTKTTTSAKPSKTADEEEEEEEDDDPIGPHVTQGMPNSLGDLDGPQNKGVSNTEGTPSETSAGGSQETGEPSSASSVRTAGFGGLILAMVASFVLL